MIINMQLQFESLEECAAFFAKHHTGAGHTSLVSFNSLTAAQKTATSPIDMAPEPAPSVQKTARPRKPKEEAAEPAPGPTVAPETTNSLMAEPEEPAQEPEAEAPAPAEAKSADHIQIEKDPNAAYVQLRGLVAQVSTAKGDQAVPAVLKAMGLTTFKEIQVMTGNQQTDALLDAITRLRAALKA